MSWKKRLDRTELCYLFIFIVLDDVTLGSAQMMMIHPTNIESKNVER